MVMTTEEQMNRLRRFMDRRSQRLAAVETLTTRIAAELYRIERDLQQIVGSLSSSK